MAATSVGNSAGRGEALATKTHPLLIVGAFDKARPIDVNPIDARFLFRDMQLRNSSSDSVERGHDLSRRCEQKELA